MLVLVRRAADFCVGAEPIPIPIPDSYSYDSYSYSSIKHENSPVLIVVSSSSNRRFLLYILYYGARARAGGTCLVAVLHAASVIGC